VLESNGLFHVVPARFVDVSGQVWEGGPLLDTKISVLPRQRTGLELIAEVCRSVSAATGQTVVEGSIPSGLLAGTTLVTAADETARSVLSRFLAELPDNLSWRLLYDPGLQWYVLNIRVVSGTGN
jgi:hypothetical protein